MNKHEQLQSEGEDRFKGSEEEERGGEEGSSPFALGKKKKSRRLRQSVSWSSSCASVARAIIYEDSLTVQSTCLQPTRTKHRRAANQSQPKPIENT